MNGRRLGSALVLLALGSLTGCASWCARNYPCPAPAAYAPAAPCYCAPAAAPACGQVRSGYFSNCRCNSRTNVVKPVRRSRLSRSAFSID